MSDDQPLRPPGPVRRPERDLRGLDPAELLARGLEATSIPTSPRPATLNRVAAPQTEVLVFVDGAEVARVILPTGAHTFGSSADCSVQVDAPHVSRQHARLTVGEGGSLLLADLGSTNGTFLDGVRIVAPMSVRPNQSIQIGAATLLIQQCIVGAEATGDIPPEIIQTIRYEPGVEIAKGGMGAVLAARQPAIRREVALKVMLRNVSAHDRLRFIEEAQITGQLEHPNIVPVHDLALNEHGQPYYTMKLVRGNTLRDVLKLLAAGDPAAVSKYSLATLITTFQKICDAVAFAHSKGVIHRDLKPANIMVGEFGEVLVMDWGLAKVLRAERAATPVKAAVSSAREDQRDVFATLDGAVMGTPQYMSPEQARGEIATLDARSDLFSLGAILYEMVTLSPPFSGKTTREILARIVDGQFLLPNAYLRSAGEQRPRHLRAAAVPDSLEAVIAKALAPGSDNRYQRVEELQADLTAYQSGFATGAEKAGAWKQLTLLIKRHKALATAISASVLLVAGITLAFTTRVVAERNRAEAARDTLAQNQLELETKNAEAKRMLAETAQSDRAIARELMRQERYNEALAYLARACEYAPESPFAAEQAVAMGNAATFRHPLLPPSDEVLDKRGRLLSPDGKRRVEIRSHGGNAPDEISLVEAGTGKLIRVLAGHTSGVYGARFSADGMRIVTPSNDHTARVWDGLTGEPLLTLTDGQQLNVYSAEFSPDGTRIVTGSADSGARIWNAATGQMVTALSGHQNRVEAAAFSPDGMRIVTGSMDRTARVWDAATGRLLLALPVHPLTVYDAGFHSDGLCVVTRDQAGVQMMWDTLAGFPDFAGLNTSVSDAEFSPDGTLVVTVSMRDKTARVWEVATGRAIVTLSGHQDLVARARFSPDGKRIVTASTDKTARIWETATGKMTATLSGHEDRVYRAQFNADGSRVVTLSADGRARVWDAATGRLLATTPPEMVGTTEKRAGRLTDVQFSLVGTRIVTAFEFPFLARVWDSESGAPVATLSGVTNPLWSAEFSPDGKRIVTSSQINGVWVWDTSSGRHIFTLDHSTQPEGWHTRQAKFSPDGTLILTICDDKAAWLWNAATGKLITRFAGHLAYLRSSEFGLDGTRILTAGEDGTARIWETATGRNIVTFASGNKADRWTAHFSPNGHHIVTVASMGRPQLWDLLGTTKPPPPWFGHFLKALGGRALNADGEPAPLPTAEWQSYLHEVTEAVRTDTTRYGDIARYYLAFGPARPTHPGSRITYGEVADRLISPGASKDQLEQAYGLHPAHPLIHLALAKHESDSTRVTFLREYDLKRLPDDLTLWVRAAQLLHEQKDAPRARQALQKLQKLAPEKASALRKELGVETADQPGLPDHPIVSSTDDRMPFGLEGTWTHNIPWNDGKERTLVLKASRDGQAQVHFEFVQQAFSYKPIFTEFQVKEGEVEISFKMVLYADESKVSPHTLKYVLKETNGTWSGRLLQSWENLPVNVILKKQL